MVTTKEQIILKSFYEAESAIILKSLNNTEVFEVDTSGDLIDEIQGEFLIHLQEHLSERDLLKLQRIQASLKKINEGGFGICVSCEDEICFERLKAIPGVSLCITCAQKLEIEKYNKTRTRY